MGDLFEAYRAMVYAILIGVALTIEQLIRWINRKRGK